MIMATDEHTKQHEQPNAPARGARLRNNLRVLLRQQYDDSVHCDATLKVGEESASAHRCVLAAMSPYFRKIFPKDGKSGPKEVDLSDNMQSIRPVTSVLEFIYHGEIQIKRINVKGLFQAAHLFKIRGLEESCVHFLLQNLSAGSSLWIWAVSYDVSIVEVEDISKNVVLSRFHDTLITRNEALEMPSNQLLYLLREGLARFCSKSKLENYLQLWYQKDKSGREDSIRDIRIAAGLPFGPNSSMTSDVDNNTERSGHVLSMENSADISDNAKVEEVIIYDNERKNVHLIYRPDKKTWLTLGIPKRHTDLYVTIRPVAFGIGPSSEWVCFIAGKRIKLLNNTTKQVIAVPVDDQNPDCDLDHSGKSFAICDFEDYLCNLREHVYSADGPVEMTKTTGKMTTSSKGSSAVYHNRQKMMWKFSFERFNIQTRRWEHICESAAEPGDYCIKMRYVGRFDGSGYIVCVRDPSKLLIWHVTSGGKLTQLASPPAKIPLRKLLANIQDEERFLILGTNDQLLVKLQKTALAYKIHENKWEVKPFPRDLPPQPKRKIVETHYGRDGNIYLFYKPCRSTYLEAGIYNPFKQELTDVPHVPSYFQPTGTSSALVRSSFLDRLEEATCEDSLEECLLGQNETQRTLKSYQRRWRQEALDDVSCGELYDDADLFGCEEDTEEEENADAAFHDIMAREAKTWPSGIPPFI